MTSPTTPDPVNAGSGASGTGLVAAGATAVASRPQPSPSPGGSLPEGEPPADGLVKLLGFGCIVMLLLAIAGCIFPQQFGVPLAKILVAVVMIISGIIAMVFVVYSPRIEQELKLAEIRLEEARDQVVVAGMLARAQLADIKARMEKHPEEERAKTISTIIKALPPIVSMLAAKETSLLKWGVSGFKLAQSLMKYFKKG